MDIKILEDLQKTFHEFKSANDSAVEEMKKFGTVSSDLQTKTAQMQARMDALEGTLSAQYKTENANLIGRLDKLEALLDRKGFAYGDSKKEVDAKRQQMKDLFFKGLRAYNKEPEQVYSTDELKLVREAKTMVLGNDTTGGFLSPIEYVQEILSEAVEYSPVRTLARIRTTTRAGIQIPKKTQSAAATWVAEQGSRTETQNPAFGMEEIKTHELHALAKISKQDLEDSAFDLEGFLRAEFGEQFGVAEGTAFISGNGVTRPEGVLTHTAITHVASGHATQLTGDGLIALFYDLPEAYIQNSTFACSRSTLKTIRTLKDGAGNYLWAPGLRADARPATILDRPYATCPDMPAVGAGNFPVVFGDWRRGMIIVDRLVMEVMVDPYTSKGTGMVEFSARRRVGGQVVLANAFRKLEIAAS